MQQSKELMSIHKVSLDLHKIITIAIEASNQEEAHKIADAVYANTRHKPFWIYYNGMLIDELSVDIEQDCDPEDPVDIHYDKPDYGFVGPSGVSFINQLVRFNKKMIGNSVDTIKEVIRNTERLLWILKSMLKRKEGEK